MIANGIVDPAPSTEDWIVEDKGEIKEVPASLKDKFEFLYGPIDDLEFNWGDPAADGETAYIENNSYALETDPAADGEMAATEDIIDALETQVKTAYALVEKKDRRVRDLQQRLNYFSEYYDPALTEDLAATEDNIDALETELEHAYVLIESKDHDARELVNANDKLQSEITNLKQMLDYFARYAKQTPVCLENAYNWIDTLREDLADEEATVRALATQLDDHQDELDAKDKMIEEMADKVSSLRTERDIMFKKMTDIENDLKIKNASIVKLIHRMKR